jgi:hypothetical protein
MLTAPACDDIASTIVMHITKLMARKVLQHQWKIVDLLPVS